MTKAIRNHATTDHVSARAHNTIDRIASSAGKGEEKIRRGAAAAEARIRDTGHQARERSENLLHTVSDFVRGKPMASIGLAFAAGTLLSFLTRQR